MEEEDTPVPDGGEGEDGQGLDMVEVKDDGYAHFGVDDPEETPAPPAGEEKAEEEEEKDEEKEEKEEEKEEEKDEEADQEAGFALYSRIRQEYPDIVKKGPELRGQIFGAYAYRGLFGSLDNAREIMTRAEEYEQIQEQVFSGDPSGVLGSLASHDKAAYTKFAESFLPTLFSHDKATFARVADPVVRNAIAGVYAVGKQTGDKNLMNSAMHFARHFFNEFAIPEMTDFGKQTKPDPEKAKLEEERQAFITERYESLRGEVTQECNSAAGEMIEAALREFKLSPFLQKAVVRDVAEELASRLRKDELHNATMSRLWNEAQKARFAGDFKPRLRKAWIGRAKTLVPSIVRRAVQEAVGGSPASARPNPSSPRKAVPAAGATSMKPKMPRADQIDWSKTSSEDVLHGRFVPKTRR